MKLSTRFITVLVILSVSVMSLGVLLCISFNTHSEELDRYYKSRIAASLYGSIKIEDCNGVSLYNGTFSEDETVRRAFFHIIGDSYKSLPDSVLTRQGDILAEEGITEKNSTVTLTLDSRLQTAAYQLLCEYEINGTVMVIDHFEGEVKVMTATPSVDVTNRESAEEGAYLNKALCAYVPGSVFKAITAAAILEHDPEAAEYGYTCTAKEGYVTCINGEPHGRVTLATALSKSCNCGITHAADSYIDAKVLEQYIEERGLFSPDIAIDFALSEGSADIKDDLYWSVNGQADDLMTPASVASFYGAIANGGERVPLKIRKDTPSGGKESLMSTSTADFISNALEVVAREAGVNCKAFAKTGTAQTGGDSSHAWFVISLNDENAPAYTVIAFAEHGGFPNTVKRLCARLINDYILSGE